MTVNNLVGCTAVDRFKSLVVVAALDIVGDIGTSPLYVQSIGMLEAVAPMSESARACR